MGRPLHDRLFDAEGDLLQGRDDETAEAVRRAVGRRREVRTLRSAAVLEAIRMGTRKPWGPRKPRANESGAKQQQRKGGGALVVKRTKAPGGQGESLL